MTTNESTTDRVLRVALGAAAAVAGVVVGAGSTVGIVLLVVAGILLLTAATGFCPLYRVLGISTCRVPAARPGSDHVPAGH
jgi:uncharacterized membrane protein